MIIVCRFSEEKSVDRQVLPKCHAYVRTIQYFCARFSRETRFSIENVNKKNTIKTITMKRKLLLLFVCLFGALGGVKAWTSVAPENGKAYFLYNIGANSYFAGTNYAYATIPNLAGATPVIVESGHKVAFVYGGTTYRIYQSAGTRECGNTSGVNFTFDGNTDGYKLKSNNNKGDRYMDDGGWFGTGHGTTATSWKFLSVEDGLVSSGWEKVTSVETLKNQPENYLYAILSVNNSSLIVRTEASTGHGYYRSMCAPLSSSEYLFSIENYIYDSKDYFVMKAENTNAYYHAENNAAYDLVAKNQPTVDSDCRLEFEYVNNVWNIKTWTSTDNGSYWGLWTPSNGYKDGEKMAGNKTDAAKASFVIYRIPKYNLDMTGRIFNNSFETGYDFGWTHENSDDTGVKNNSGNYATTGGDGSKLFNIWWQGKPMTQNIGILPAGQYTLSAVTTTDQGAKTFLKVNSSHNEGAVSTSGSGSFVSNEYTFAFNGATETTVGVVGCASDKSTYIEEGYFWYKVDNFHLTYYGTLATASDYSELNTAISGAEAKTLGFDAGEYAPYNNVAVLNALAAAKSINQGANNQQALIQSAIRAIADGNWVANVGEQNAIPGNKTFAEGSYTYNGTYDLANGWSNSGYNTRIQGIHEGTDNTGLQDNEGHIIRHALLAKFGTSYGETRGYTLPLKANTAYEFSFEYGLWNEGGEITKGLTVTTPNGGTIEMTPSTVSKNEGDKSKCGNVLNTAWYAYSAVFMTTDAGDYILNIVNTDAGNQRQMAFSNFELKRYNGMIEDDETNTQVYYGTFKSRVDLTPTEEHPFVDITHASFDGEVFVNLYDNPNGLVYATPSQVNSIKSSYGTTEAIPNVVSNDGNVCESLVIYDGHPFFVPSHSNIQATEATYSRTIASTSNYGTICLPYAVESDKNIQYYTIGQIDGNVLKLNEVASVEAGAPAIFKKKDGGATEITVAANNVSIASDAGTNGSSVVLKGTFERITIGTDGEAGTSAANGKYYINSSNQFCEGKDWFYVGAFRAYLEAAGKNARLTLQIDDEATAISELKTLDEKQGLKDGKYLIGGKIIVVKEGKQYNVNGVIK